MPDTEPPAAQPWLLAPSPTIRLNTPTLDPLPVQSPTDWLNALSSNPNPPGFTPRFSPAFAQLQSPGVSAEVAANPVGPNAPSQALSDLFRCTEYPFSAVTPAKPVQLPHPHHPSALPKQHVVSVQPPHGSVTAPLPTSVPLAPGFPHTQKPLQQPASSNPAASLSLPKAPTLSPRPAVHPTAKASVPAVAPPSDLPNAAVTVGGQRAVLGSGLMSNAVHEAQIRARMKAESFALARKKENAKRRKSAANTIRGTNQAKSNLTAEELKQQKYRNRLRLNRESAAVSRVRRKEYVKLLEEQLVNAEKERVRLAAELMDMQKQQNKLREHLTELERAV